MRENIGIYRGKWIDTGEWKEGYLYGVQDRLTGKDLFFIVDENGEYHRVDLETVGEYTGLTDSTGTGIFEGDILESFYKKLMMKQAEPRRRCFERLMNQDMNGKGRTKARKRKKVKR